MSTPPPIAPGWRDDPDGRRRWWDGDRWGAYAPWDAPDAAPRASARRTTVRLDPSLLRDPTAAASPPRTAVRRAGDAAPKALPVAYLLLLLLGACGAHRFYLGRSGSAVAMLSLTVIGAVTAMLLVGLALLAVVAAWWVVDLLRTPGMVREANERTAAPAFPAYERGWPRP